MRLLLPGEALLVIGQQPFSKNRVRGYRLPATFGLGSFAAAWPRLVVG
jgi:hypothetical protein